MLSWRTDELKQIWAIMRILLTGFTPFGELHENPSRLIVEQVARRGLFPALITAILPTEYAASEQAVRELILTRRPAAVVSIGVAAGRDAINLERAALNLNDAPIADNAGDLANGRLIAADGPAAYWSTLPLEAMHDALHQRGIPAVISNHAGAYVCNHIFYSTRHLVEQMGLSAMCGFIHVPAIRQDEQPEKGLPLAMMVEGVEICLGVVSRYDGS